jgi:hypothetical protein
VIAFALIYKHSEEASDWTEAFYIAGTIQTLVGITNQPKSAELRVLYTIQSILAFFLAAGVIIFIKN